MSTTVGDFLIHRLTAWGVHRIYGYPGDGINGILGALDRATANGNGNGNGNGNRDGNGNGNRNRDGNGKRAGTLEFVQVRHEEMAAFMACAHAKFTGDVGVCLATSGRPRKFATSSIVPCASRRPSAR
jgi:pyruvate dehydrogenase (quinone)